MLGGSGTNRKEAVGSMMYSMDYVMQQTHWQLECTDRNVDWRELTEKV